MALAHEIYDVTRTFPREETYGMSAQMRRAAVSIPSNIAEGHGRDTTGEYLQHLSIARGSLTELETQLIIAAGLEYMTADSSRRLTDATDELSRMLRGLQKALKRLKRSPHPDERTGRRTAHPSGSE
jgi:four helix bundle protein